MNNRKKIFIVANFLLMAIAPVCLNAQNKAGFSIDGSIEGLESGEKVILKMLNANGIDEGVFESMVSTDSAYAKDGKFHIEGHAPDGPRHYMMYFDRHTNKAIELYIDNNEQVTIESGDMNKIQHGYIQHYVKINGSLANYGRMCLNPLLTVYGQSIGRLNRCIRILKDSVGFNGPVVESFIKARDEVNQALYYNILSGDADPEIEKARLILSFYLYLRSGHDSIWPGMYGRLSEDEKNTFYGKQLGEKVKLCVGQPFPEFTLPTADGRMISSKDVVAKSKITIVHFWAKNSVERKDCQNELLGLYKKYHSKGLNIIGFSTDKYKEEWLEALEESKFPWENVGDQKGTKGIAKTVYHEYSTDFDRDLFVHNTTNVVIDGQGKILAWDVRGAELQYYLWKTLGE